MLSLLIVDESRTTQTEFRVMFFMCVFFQGLLCAYYFALEEMDPTKHVMLNSPAEATLYQLTRSYISVPLVALGVMMKVFLKYADQDSLGAVYAQASCASFLAILVISELTHITHDNGVSTLGYFPKIFGNACSDKVARRLAVLWVVKFIIIIMVAALPYFGDLAPLGGAAGSVALIGVAYAAAALQNTAAYDARAMGKRD